MPERVVVEGRRSSVVDDGDALLRRYHDTGHTIPLPVCVDARGTLRVGANRPLSALLAQETGFRGTTGPQPARRPPPAHLVRARHALARHPVDIIAFARDLGVRVSTAWCYACQVLEHFPADNIHAHRLVFPPLLPALLAVDQRGTLREVMSRLNDGPLRGDADWRCIDDRFAHVRLARLCLM